MLIPTLLFTGLILGFLLPSVKMLPEAPFPGMEWKILVLSAFPLAIALSAASSFATSIVTATLGTAS